MKTYRVYAIRLPGGSIDLGDLRSILNSDNGVDFQSIGDAERAAQKEINFKNNFYLIAEMDKQLKPHKLYPDPSLHSE